MTDELPERVERAFERHDSFERTTAGFRIDTTVFESRVLAADDPEGGAVYTVTVRAPTLEAATADTVGEAVAEGWFETLERRIGDAPVATRADLQLRRATVERDGEEVIVTFGFEWADPDRAAAIAKTLVEYVEGTYVEGVIPGYEYVSPVADLIESASQAGGGGGSTPL